MSQQSSLQQSQRFAAVVTTACRHNLGPLEHSNLGLQHSYRHNLVTGHGAQQPGSAAQPGRHNLGDRPLGHTAWVSAATTFATALLV